MPKTIPPIVISIFTTDECQALLDYVERLERNAPPVRISQEEADAMDKLREAGKFYVPSAGSGDNKVTQEIKQHEFESITAEQWRNGKSRYECARCGSDYSAPIHQVTSEQKG